MDSWACSSANPSTIDDFAARASGRLASDSPDLHFWGIQCERLDRSQVASTMLALQTSDFESDARPGMDRFMETFAALLTCQTKGCQIVDFKANAFCEGKTGSHCVID